MDEIVETRVIFKYDEKAQECVAFLTDLPANIGCFLSYAHIGQHAEASYDYFRDLRLATEKEYEDLRKELESIGYRLYLRTRLRPSVRKNLDSLYKVV